MKPVVDVYTDGVYISTSEGQEIVAWTLQELEDEPDVALVIANALKLVYEEGIYALAEKIGVHIVGDPGDGTPYCLNCDIYGEPCWCGHNGEKE